MLKYWVYMIHPCHSEPFFKGLIPLAEPQREEYISPFTQGIMLGKRWKVHSGLMDYRINV